MQLMPGEDQGTVADYRRLVIDSVPLIDVRAPVEYQAGAVPGAVNLPLLQDRERHQVGLCYRQQGAAAAIALGHRLASGDYRERLLAAWREFVRQYPETHLYCARGGSRSAIARQWIGEETGRLLPRVAGGYKGFRTFLLKQLEPATIGSIPIVLGGRTGSGKTLLLQRLANGIDLEAVANHRGSTFGSFLDPQPGQADFENRLAAALVVHQHRGYRHLVVEDEGRHIGKRFVPRDLARFLAGGDVVLLEAPLRQRTERIVGEYVVTAQARYRTEFGDEDGMRRWLAEMDRGAMRLAKRLGGTRLAQVRVLLARAHERQLGSGDRSGHRDWVELLLTEYYDPMYDYQIKKKGERVVFRGEWDQVLPYLLNLGRAGETAGRGGPVV